MLKTLINRSIKKLSNDLCYPADILEKFKACNITSVDEIIMPCYELIKPLLKFNGDPGPFNLNYHCTVLIAMEVCNHVLSYTFLLGCQQKHKIWFMMIVTSIQKLHYKNLIKGILRSSPI